MLGNPEHEAQPSALHARGSIRLISTVIAGALAFEFSRSDAEGTAFLNSLSHYIVTVPDRTNRGELDAAEGRCASMVIEHSDVGAARLKVKILLLNEAQERTGPRDALELAEGGLLPVRRRRA